MHTSLRWFIALILVIGSALVFGSQRPAEADFSDRSASDLGVWPERAHRPMGLACNHRGSATDDSGVDPHSRISWSAQEGLHLG